MNALITGLIQLVMVFAVIAMFVNVYRYVKRVIRWHKIGK